MSPNECNANNWQIVEHDLCLDDVPVNETLFALGNGYLGMRGTFEEGLEGLSIEGTYVNGFYESAPIAYGEKLHGYAENKQTMLNLPNAKVIRLSLDGKAFSLLAGEILDYRRVLDVREGVLRRSVVWQSPQGKRVRIEAERLVLHTRRHLALIRYRVTPLNFDGRITIFSGIDGAVSQSQHAEDDPRLGTRFNGDVLRVEEQSFAGEAAFTIHRTVGTQFKVACGIRESLDAACRRERYEKGRTIGYTYTIEGRRDVPVTLFKAMAYATSLDTGDLVPAVLGELEKAIAAGFEALCEEQRRYLRCYWDVADVVIEGDDAAQRGIRFNLFHILQSTGRDGRTNVPAKGLTGLGYEGHYFWDTETYVLPFFLHTQPEVSRKLLEFRYRTLDRARERARQMAHPRGALYPWRTINGEECSANYAMGTAQYHIDADVAFAVHRYYDATEDAEFMKAYGAEILCETARLWYDAGDLVPAKGDRFCINGVTGPDEYHFIVNNNAYTNLMARENLRRACDALAWLRAEDVAAYDDLVARIALEADEPAAWREAAGRIYVPYDEERGIIPQDDAFLDKAVWDFAGTPPEHHPLLLHYHPLVITRYQVCKQADLVLAEFLLHDQFDLEQKRRDYDYYEPITTHDSSLSPCVFGIVASELGYDDKAYHYFREGAFIDLENKHGNTEAGIHAAGMAGAWQSVVFGFAGMRAGDGLSFAPAIPEAWEAYAFKVRYRGRLVAVRVTPEGMSFDLLEGAPLEIRVNGEVVPLA